MTFPELVKKTGFHLATKIQKKVAGQDFEEKMTFAEWQEVIEIIDSAQNGKPFKEVRKYLQPRAETYAEWKVVLDGSHYQGSDELPQKTEVMDRLFSAIGSVAECIDFYSTCGREDFFTSHWGSRYRLAIIEKAIRLDPGTFDNWMWVNSLVKNEGSTRDICLKKIEETASTFDEWLQIHNSFGYPEDLRQRAFNKLIELAR